MIYATLEVKIVVHDESWIKDVVNDIKNFSDSVQSVEVKFKEEVK